MLVLAAVLSTMQYEGDITAAGGDYAEVEFAVPAGTREIQIAHSDGSDAVVLDFGVWDAANAFRGWGGGNTEDIVIGVDESSRSYRIGPIAPGAWRLVIGKAQLDAAGTGHYAVEVTCRDDATLPVRARAAYTPVTLATAARWYRGDFHVHSSESGDANASHAQIGALAASRGLDFVLLSEHNTDAQLPLQAAAQAASPTVLFLRGAEITTYAGHANAVGLPQYVDHRIGLGGRTIEAVVADVKAASALFLVNHPVLDLGDACIGCSWEHAATPWAQVDGMEIITGKWELVEGLFVGRAIARWDALLDQGFRIAAVSGSDDHRAGTGTGSTDTPIGSPTTLVYATALSEAAIAEGVRAGRTIVQLRGPDDPLVTFTINGDGQLGDQLSAVDHVAAEVTVAGGEGMFAQLWRDGVALDTVRVDAADFTHTFEDVPGAAPHRYRLELTDEIGRRIVVTSHIYVDGIAAPDDGGGCCQAARTPAPALWLLVGAALLRRRRRYHGACTAASRT